MITYPSILREAADELDRAVKDGFSPRMARIYGGPHPYSCHLRDISNLLDGFGGPAKTRRKKGFTQDDVRLMLWIAHVGEQEVLGLETYTSRQEKGFKKRLRSIRAQARRFRDLARRIQDQLTTPLQEGK